MKILLKYDNNSHGHSFVALLVAQSCPSLCDPVDCGPPGSSVHGIFQTRILKQFAISFSELGILNP